MSLTRGTRMDEKDQDRYTSFRLEPAPAGGRVRDERRTLIVRSVEAHVKRPSDEPPA